MEPSDEQYIAVNTQSYPAGQGEVFVWDYTGGVFHLIPESLRQVLQLTNRFRSLKAHRNELIEAGWQDDGSGTIDDMLEELVQTGLLRASTTFLQTVTDVSVPEKDQAFISSLGWVTRDRPELLKRSVGGFIDNCVENDRQVDYKIFDDSSNEKTRIETRSLLSELAESRGVRILYAGQEEKREYADRIMRKAAPEKLPEEVLEFALFDPFEIGFTSGANSNALLLATAGELYLMIDDDVVGRFCRPEETEEGLALDSSPDPTRFRFFADRTDLLRNTDFQDLCILEAHEKLLGRSLSERLKSSLVGGNIDVSRLSTEFLRLLELSPGKVTVTMTGVCGDCGMGSSRMFLGLMEENRAVLLDSEESYRSALVSREVLRVVDRPTVGPGSLLMTMNCGFDNRALLPPFFPVLRGSDGLFAHTLGACQPESTIGYLPVACFHDPQEQRVGRPEEVVSSSIRMADMLTLLVRSFKGLGKFNPGKDRYKELGSHLLQLGGLSTSRFVEVLRMLWTSEMSRYIEYLEFLLSLNNYKPGYWAEHVMAYIDSIRVKATSTEVIVDDLIDSAEKGKTDILCQELVSSFGSLLCWWPLIWETSRSLKSEQASLFTQL